MAESGKMSDTEGFTPLEELGVEVDWLKLRTIIRKSLDGSLRDLCKSRSSLPERNPIYDYMSNQYVDAAIIAIRRLTERERASSRYPTMSLHIWLHKSQHVACCSLRSCDRCRNYQADLRGDYDKVLQNRDIVSGISQTQIERLDCVAKRVEHVADKHLAHYELSALEQCVSLSDIYDSVDSLEEIINSYRKRGMCCYGLLDLELAKQDADLLRLAIESQFATASDPKEE